MHKYKLIQNCIGCFSVELQHFTGQWLDRTVYYGCKIANPRPDAVAKLFIRYNRKWHEVQCINGKLAIFVP